MLVCLVPFLALSQTAVAALTTGCRFEEEEDSEQLKKPCQKLPVILHDMNPRSWYPDSPDHFSKGFNYCFKFNPSAGC